MPGRQLIRPILHPAPRTMFHGHQIVHLDKPNANICPKEKSLFELCEIAPFPWQPIIRF